jgi:hypothetical protein
MRIPRLDLSMAQDKAAGKFLGHIYYGNKGLIELFKMVDERSGFPHNGGSHTLRLYNVTVDDIVSFLKLITETQFNSKVYQQAKFAFVSEALKRLQKYPGVPTNVRNLMAA